MSPNVTEAMMSLIFVIVIITIIITTTFARDMITGAELKY